MERWLDEIKVTKVFNSLTKSLKEKENQNNLLKLKIASQYYLTKEKENQKSLADYVDIQTKYDKLEKLIFDKQINIKLINNNNNNNNNRVRLFINFGFRISFSFICFTNKIIYGSIIKTSKFI